MITRLYLGPCFSLILFCGLFTTACVSISGTAAPVRFQSYDLPGTLGSSTVIRAVERAFARTLSTPPRIIEGSVPSPLPAMPAHFTVEDRRVQLERLGMVSIPEVVCPESMAIVQALVADKSKSSGPHSYIGCIQVYARGYRVSVVDSRMVVHGSDTVRGALEPEPKSGHDLLTRIAQALREQISEARLVADSHTQESATPVWRADAKSSTDHERSTGVQVASLASPPDRSAATHAGYQERNVVSTLPLVCLAPRHESASVRTDPGGGVVVMVLDSGSMMAVAEPVDAAYFRVETENGMVGWVNNSDVRRLPCPIG